ncbi:MAG TPA: thioesterase family protein [Acidimicrobiales bacterium]|nr:thioesterase family protein [Acidimicrobiales bacterium]
MTGCPDPADVELLGLSFDPDGRQGRFTLTPRVSRGDGALYGGTAIAVAVVAMEAATRRPCLWITTQYVSQASTGDVIDCPVEVLSNGRHISQCQVTGRLGDRVLFVALGSTAAPRPDGMEGQYEEMPAVTGPDRGVPMATGPGPRVESPPADQPGFHSWVEVRVAETLGPPESAPHMALWARIVPTAAPEGWTGLTRAGIAFLADMVPPAIARAAGIAGGGISLDNSMRFGSVPDGVEWVLMDLRGHMAAGSHGHGSVRVWTPDGALVAVGGQSANMRFNFGRLDSPEARAAWASRAAPGGGDDR